MMQTIDRVTCASEQAMADLAARVAGMVQAGDLIALTGDLGAGKSTFARALIRALAADPGLEVPSPTFTLVQTYEAADGLPVIHTDLYRLEGEGDVEDLGLDEELPEALTLVEWPDRMPADWWYGALAVTIEMASEDGARHVTFSSDDQGWAARYRQQASEAETA